MVEEKIGIIEHFIKKVNVAAIKIINSPLKIAEFSFTEIPNNSNKPVHSSIHGKIIAEILIKKSGSNL